MDKVARCGIRIIDLITPAVFALKLKDNLQEKNPLFEKAYETKEFSYDAVYHEYQKYAEIIKPYVCDPLDLFYKNNRKSFLFEGAQGTFLDVDFGTYPFVTSSSTIASNVLLGSGLSFVKINEVIGVAKAYTTRVGEGPFPTQLSEELGQYFQKKGKEFGATTGRPRRCGWLDLVLLKRAKILNNINKIILTKLDILDELKEIKVCVKYTQNKVALKTFPMDLSCITPVYESIKGWRRCTEKVRKYKDLPDAAKRYIGRIEKFLNCGVSYISVGEMRDAIIKKS
jgi:adenylosuccinate synthase